MLPARRLKHLELPNKVESKERCMVISSTHIKCALYAYWRYRKQFICADEVGVCQTDADIIVDTGGFLFEIEVKISRSDLIQGEKRKDKHLRYLGQAVKSIPNQFYICVPTKLVDVAKEWATKTNPKYGVLEYVVDDGYRKWEQRIRVAKRAKFLHENKISDWQKERIARRLSSARATFMMDRVQNYVDPGEQDYII